MRPASSSEPGGEARPAATAFGVRYRFRPIGRLGSVASWCVAAHALALAIGAALAVQMAGSDQVWSVRRGAATAGGAYLVGPFVGPVSVILTVHGLTLLAAMVAWLVWQSRAHEDVWAAGAGGRITPAWAVLWWFVPFANMVKPATAVKELLHGTGYLVEDRGHDGWLRGAWWAAFLAGQVTSLVGVMVMFAQAMDRLDLRFAASTLGAEDIGTGLVITAVGWSLQAIAAWPAIVIVRTADRRLGMWASSERAQAWLGEPELAGVPARPDVG